MKYNIKKVIVDELSERKIAPAKMNHNQKYTIITMSDTDQEFVVLHRKFFNTIQQLVSADDTDKNDLFMQGKK